MKRIAVYLFAIALVIFLSGSIFAEFRIAKDRTPGGLYVVGPDISVDSSEGQRGLICT